jgi:hypothetical protein
MEDKKNYETPQIVDHGDLTELTAATNTGSLYDGNYAIGKQVVPDQTNP